MITKKNVNIKLILNPKNMDHVSSDTVNEFEQSILSEYIYNVLPVFSNIFLKHIGILLWRLLNKYNKRVKWIRLLNKLITINFHTNICYVCVLMGTNWNKCFPYFFSNSRKSIYLFDAWTNQHSNINTFLDSIYNINFVFISSRQAVQALQAINKKQKFYWIPEGIKKDIYKYYPYQKKDIDVLSFGRKYEQHHTLIVDELKNQNKIYLYEKIKGEIIFPTRDSFVDGLARTKISICVPSNITHPERAGEIETMTIRYLQSMVSKCLILGHAPNEMIELFGYNPVIEIDMENPVKQILSILNNFDKHIPLIEKNFNIVLKNHTWQHRWAKMLEILNS